MNRNNLYKEIFDEATAIINEIDPMGLIQGGAPPDEYSGETTRTLVELKKSTSNKDFAERLRKVFDDQPNRDIHAVLAEKLMPLKEKL